MLSVPWTHGWHWKPKPEPAAIVAGPCVFILWPPPVTASVNSVSGLSCSSELLLDKKAPAYPTPWRLPAISNSPGGPHLSERHILQPSCSGQRTPRSPLGSPVTLDSRIRSMGKAGRVFIHNPAHSHTLPLSLTASIAFIFFQYYRKISLTGWPTYTLGLTFQLPNQGTSRLYKPPFTSQSTW